MNKLSNQNGWEQRLREGLGAVPAPDFQAWKAANAEIAEILSSQEPTSYRIHQPTRRILVSSLKLIAASLLVAVSLHFFFNSGPNGRAFADLIPGVDDPKTMSWTTTFFSRVTSADGMRTWIVPERRLHAYRSPGQYRETRLDEKGEPYAVEITDVRAGRTLLVDLKAKNAVLMSPKRQLDIRGPFAWVGEAVRDRMVAQALPVKSVSIQGKKEIDKKKATVVRAMIDEGGEPRYLRRDFMFDDSSKHLVGIWLPNEKDFDFEAAPDLGKPAEEKWSTSKALGYLVHEIVVDASIDPKEFSLDAPGGYTLEKIASPTVTEEEMVAYLGACARFNNGTFSDSPYETFDTAKFNAVSQKAETEQLPVEKEMIAQHDKFLMREIYRSPVRQFLDDQVVDATFHYVGAGLRLEGPKQIVCWFTLKGTTKPRGVFSDLSVRELTASEIPFAVSK
jgi:hypothetical protein